MNSRRGPTRMLSQGSQPAGSQRWWQRPWLVRGSVGLVVLGALAFSVISRRPGAEPPTSGELSEVVQHVTHVRPEVLDAVGSGTGPNQVRGADGPLLNGAEGKPQLVYIGAEFCPYCASERWPLIIALSRFGEFENLKLIQSASNDAYPNTATLSFDRSQYRSPYIDFVPVETETRDHVPLRVPSPRQQALFARYDVEDVIPFVDIGNRHVVVGSGFVPSVLQGRNWQDIARALDDPTDVATVAIVGHANHLAAAICKLTEEQPASVCRSAAVASAAND